MFGWLLFIRCVEHKDGHTQLIVEGPNGGRRLVRQALGLKTVSRSVRLPRSMD